MKKVYTLSTCDTSKKILKLCNITNLYFEIKDIKTSSITQTELEEMRSFAGSYEALFSRRSRKYKSMGLKDVVLKEDDYKRLVSGFRISTLQGWLDWLKKEAAFFIE